MGIKDFFVKKLIESKLKGVPKEQQEQIIAVVQENPELFEKIGKEIQNKTKNEGKSEMVASMEVMRKYQSEIQNAMMKGK
jgi:GTPase